MSAQSAPLRLPASSLSPLLPFPLFPLSVLTLLPPLGRPLLNAVLSSRSPHITLVQTTSLSPFRQPYWLACLVSGNRSYFDNLISLRPVPRAPLLVPVSSRRLDVHTVSSFLLASGSGICVVVDDGCVLLFALYAQHGSGSVVAVGDLNADPFAFAVGPGAADLATVLTNENLDVLR
jgi:hypothetical protein